MHSPAGRCSGRGVLSRCQREIPAHCVRPVVEADRLCVVVVVVVGAGIAVAVAVVAWLDFRCRPWKRAFDETLESCSPM